MVFRERVDDLPGFSWIYFCTFIIIWNAEIRTLTRRLFAKQLHTNPLTADAKAQWSSLSQRCYNGKQNNTVTARLSSCRTRACIPWTSCATLWKQSPEKLLLFAIRQNGGAYKSIACTCCCRWSSQCVCLQGSSPTGRPSTCWLSRTSSLPHAQLLPAIRRWRWKSSIPLSTPPSPITWQVQSVDDWQTPQPPRRLQGMKLSPWPPAIFHSFYVIYESLTAACSPSVCVSHSEAGNCHLLVLKRLLLTSQSHVWLWAFCQLLLNT